MKPTLFSLLLILSFYSYSQTDFSWLEGSWRGPGFGGIMEEFWSSPDQNGNMIGMFRHSNEDGTINFMEFWQLTKNGLKLKHFNPDMTGWEEKQDFIDFKFVNSEKNKLVLEGLIYELSDKGTLKISLEMKQGDKVSIEHFELTKVK